VLHYRWGYAEKKALKKEKTTSATTTRRKLELRVRMEKIEGLTNELINGNCIFFKTSMLISRKTQLELNQTQTLKEIKLLK
jgi:hypothetical protein